MCISGQVVRTHPVHPELVNGTFICMDCQTVIKDVEQQFKYMQVHCSFVNRTNRMPLRALDHLLFMPSFLLHLFLWCPLRLNVKPFPKAFSFPTGLHMAFTQNWFGLNHAFRVEK